MPPAIPPVPPGKKTGLIPRNYKSHPPGYLACCPTAPDDWIIPEDEWQDRLDAQLAAKISLWDLREANYDALKSLDQNGFGLCWAFSTTKAVMYTRALMGEPPVTLSAWYVAGIINGWRDEGGWGAASLEFITKTGVPAMEKCPKYSRSVVAADAEQNAALHKVMEWYDGSEDRDKNRAIMVSAFLLGLPPVLDYNWLSHSMCGCRLVSVKPSLVVDTDNSWGDVDQYGAKGTYRLTGNHAIPDGIVVPRVSLPSTV
jgi:hypothetical protein